jgi:hypothetical protein
MVPEFPPTLLITGTQQYGAPPLRLLQKLPQNMFHRFSKLTSFFTLLDFLHG